MAPSRVKFHLSILGDEDLSTVITPFTRPTPSMFGFIPKSQRTKEQQESHEKIVSGFKPLKIVNAFAVKRFVSWDLEKKLTGGFLPNIPQEIGDCTSFGMAHAADRTALAEIAAGDNEVFHATFPPFYYGASRAIVGKGQISGDGSLGSWTYEVARTIGNLAADAQGVPRYSGSIARKWGNSGPPADMLALAKPHLFKDGARVTNSGQLAEALANGYFATIASMRGFSMRLADRDGKSWFVGRDTWPHQMAFTGVDVSPRLCFYRLNSWGPDAHGPQLDGPPGGGWQDADDVDKELRDGDTECYVYSRFDGWPGQDVESWLLN